MKVSIATPIGTYQELTNKIKENLPQNDPIGDPFELTKNPNSFNIKYECHPNDLENCIRNRKNRRFESNMTE